MPPRINTVIVGAGPAGLATAHRLGEAGVPHLLLEQRARVAEPWRQHYERLHLHTTKGLSALPNLAWPPQTARYPARADVVEYLDACARRLPHAPRFGQHVRLIERDGDGWRTQTDDAVFRSDNVVVATGNTRVPHLPEWPGQADYTGDLMHSAVYRTGQAWAGQRVLVVGFGNSACEIAIDLHEQGAQPTLAVRGGVNIIPRDVLGIPILAVGLALNRLPPSWADAVSRPLLAVMIGDMRKLGLQALPYGPITQIRRHGRVPLLDIGTVALMRRGAIQVRPGLRRFTASGVEFADGRQEDFAAVVLATGYRPGVAGLFGDAARAVCDADGVPLRSGVPVLPGLYFCGFHVSATGMLREIGLESRRIAESILRGSPVIP